MPKSQRGMSLIESLISLAILSVGLIAVTKMQTNVAFANQTARQRVEAVNLAKSKLEEFRHTKACVATTGSGLTHTPMQGSAAYTMTITCADTQSPKIVVTWNDARGTQAKVAAGDDTLSVDNRVELSTQL